MSKLNSHLLFMFAISCFLAGPAQAAPMSTNEMVVLLREAKVVSPGCRLDVLQSDQEVTVITRRTPKMLDDDCKIKAVLMAKALMDAQPKQLAAVKVIYTLDAQSAVSRVVVGAGDVQSFANGAITEKQLLASLDLIKESSEDSEGGKASVVAGPQKERRAILQARIESLKQGGTGVAPFQKMFADIEDLTRAGKAKEASQLISDLSTKLSSQEALRDQAKRVGEGRGVKGNQGTTNDDKWHPGAALQASRNAPLNSSDFQTRIGWMKSRLSELEKSGVSTADLRQRLNDAEQQGPRLTAQQANARLEDIKCRIMQACQQRFPNAGGWRK
ncbi:MAG TPA: hypothetical protein PKZ32_04300 [Candidatus Melainabacteria bacterium]|nr:hypothetical protein [Candidatus Melainabacteria bacterium]